MVCFNRGFDTEMYIKDISKKVKSALLTRQRQGKFIGTKAPYGYKKDPADKNHLIIDERYAPVVSKIFELAKNGLGVTAISRLMRQEKIIRPAAVAADENQSFSAFTDDNKKYEWTNTAVRCILNVTVKPPPVQTTKIIILPQKPKSPAEHPPAGAKIIQTDHSKVKPVHRRSAA